MVALHSPPIQAMDITERFLEFREAARHLWNVYFRQDSKSPDWDERDEFSEAYVALFNAMVRYQLPPGAASIPHLGSGESTALPGYHVVFSLSEILPLMINRDIPAAGYWDHPTQQVEGTSVRLGLVSIFDWDQLGFRDFRYLRVRIMTSSDPGLVGRDALVEAGACRLEYHHE